MTNRRPTTLYLVLALYIGLLASSARGAGLEGHGATLLIPRSTPLGNDAIGEGGGLRNIFGTVTIESSTVPGNEGSARGV